jgi:hypothetical protein
LFAALCAIAPVPISSTSQCTLLAQNAHFEYVFILLLQAIQVIKDIRHHYFSVRHVIAELFLD